jgi:hypothetical protein
VIGLLLSRLAGGIVEALFYWPGWLLLRVLTLGRYPPRQSVGHNRFAVALFACAVLVSSIAFLSAYAAPPPTR